MNIKQAKQRFTELTGLEPTRKNILIAIRENKGTYSDWLKSGLCLYPNAKNLCDCRTKECWLSLVNYLECLISFEKTEFTFEQATTEFSELTNLAPTKAHVIARCSRDNEFAKSVNTTVRELKHFETRSTIFWKTLVINLKANGYVYAGGNN